MTRQLTIDGIILQVSSSGRVLLQLQDDKVVATRELQNDEHVASLLTFLEIAEGHGFLVKSIESKL